MNDTALPSPPLARTQLLREIAACPACGAADGVEEGAARNGKDYAAALARFGVPIAEIRVLRCGGCGSLWRKPWVAETALHALYTQAMPSHPGGWHFGAIGGAVPGGGDRLNRFFRQHLGSFDSYGEFGCPNWGLLAYYAAPRYVVLGGLAHLGSDALVLGASCGDLAEASTRKGRWARALLRFRRTRAPARLAHIAASANLFWGAACAQDGVACADRLRVQAPRAHRYRLDDPPAEPLDLLAAISVIDHYPDPAELLRRFGRFARHLFVFTHGPRHGWKAVQHVVNFSPEGLAALGQRSGWTCVATYRKRDEKTDYGMLFRRVS